MKIDAKEVLADLKDCVQVDLSKFGVLQTEKIIIPVIDSVLLKLNKLIPGPIDDAVVASIKPQLYKEVKEELEKLLNKVDDVINGDDK